MRPKRKTEETWVINTLFDHFASKGEKYTEDLAFTDNPDLVIENESGLRIACEISGIPINEWHQLKNDPRKQLGINKLDSLVLPREADIWIRNVIDAKNKKIQQYINNTNSKQAWLLIHGGEMTPYDFFALDEEDLYDIRLMQKSAIDTSHFFNRIYVISSSSKTKIFQIYPPSIIGLTVPNLNKPGTMKALNLRSMAIKTNAGVNRIKIGKEFKPDRKIILKPLDPTRK